MTITISLYNNKGGVGKTTLCWNVADALGRLGKRVLLIDFDPQCNLSLAVLGEDGFKNILPSDDSQYGKTIRSYLQRFLQSTGGEELFFHKGQKTHKNVDLIAGDFWLNVYSESLSVGSDLLTGTGISKYAVINDIISFASSKYDKTYDYVFVDIPPSFGALVRVALYSSNYFIIPCTSDTFSAYCIGLIGEMLPTFQKDWDDGLERFQRANQNLDKFDDLGHPEFAGWIFNGFDMRAGVVVRADGMHKDNIIKAIQEKILDPDQLGVADDLPHNHMIGDIEDMNVLIQNSIWQSIPVGQLETVRPLQKLRDRGTWANNQIEQIRLLKRKFKELATNIINICK